MTPEEYSNKLHAWGDAHKNSLSFIDDWHARRLSGVGGSEIAAVMGKNEYKTAHELWLEKTLKTPQFRGNAATLKGQILEDAVAKYYEEATGNAVERDETHYRSEDAPWLVGNIDRRIVNGGILECKTSKRNTPDDETEDGFKWGMGNEYDADKNIIKECDQVPLNYYLQCQHYMCITGAPFCDLAVLFLASDFKPFRVYRIERNEEVIAKIKTAAHDFMLMVLDDVEPPMTDAELVKKYSEDISSDESIELDDALYEEYRIARNELYLLQDKIDLLQEKIKLRMGDFGVATVGGKKVMTWKSCTKTTFNSKAFKEKHPDLYENYATTSIYRTLRVCSLKEKK